MTNVSLEISNLSFNFVGLFILILVINFMIVYSKNKLGFSYKNKGNTNFTLSIIAYNTNRIVLNFIVLLYFIMVTLFCYHLNLFQNDTYTILTSCLLYFVGLSFTLSTYFGPNRKSHFIPIFFGYLGGTFSIYLLFYTYSKYYPILELNNVIFVLSILIFIVVTILGIIIYLFLTTKKKLYIFYDIFAFLEYVHIGLFFLGLTIASYYPKLPEIHEL